MRLLSIIAFVSMSMASAQKVIVQPTKHIDGEGVEVLPKEFELTDKQQELLAPEGSWIRDLLADASDEEVIIPLPNIDNKTFAKLLELADNNFELANKTFNPVELEQLYMAANYLGLVDLVKKFQQETGLRTVTVIPGAKIGQFLNTRLYAGPDYFVLKDVRYKVRLYGADGTKRGTIKGVTDVYMGSDYFVVNDTSSGYPSTARLYGGDGTKRGTIKGVREVYMGPDYFVVKDTGFDMPGTARFYVGDGTLRNTIEDVRNVYTASDFIVMVRSDGYQIFYVLSNEVQVPHRVLLYRIFQHRKDNSNEPYILEGLDQSLFKELPKALREYLTEFVTPKK